MRMRKLIPFAALAVLTAAIAASAATAKTSATPIKVAVLSDCQGAFGSFDGQDLAAPQVERNAVEDAPRAVPAREFHRGVPAGENEVRLGLRRSAGACRIHGAVTTILLWSIATDS